MKPLLLFLLSFIFSLAARTQDSTATANIMNAKDNYSLNFILLGGGKLLYYDGKLTDVAQAKPASVADGEGFKKIIQQKIASVTNKEKVVLLFKMTDKADYSDVTKVLQMVSDYKIKMYAVVDMTPEEQKMLGVKSAFKDGKEAEYAESASDAVNEIGETGYKLVFDLQNKDTAYYNFGLILNESNRRLITPLDYNTVAALVEAKQKEAAAAGQPIHFYLKADEAGTRTNTFRMIQNAAKFKGVRKMMLL
jgi:hypothetical protein